MPDFDFQVNGTLPNKSLGDGSLGPEVASATVSFSGTPSVGGLSFGFGVGASASLTDFNSPDDKDSDEGIAPAKTTSDDPEQDFGPVRLPPPLTLDPANAWLKYRFEGNAKASASAAYGALGFKIEGSLSAAFADYRKHSRAELLPDAFRSDALQGSGLRFAASFNDILALQPGDALMYRVAGQLTASVTLKWSDAYSLVLSEVSQLLGNGQLVGVNINVGASLGFNVGIRDDFRLFFTKSPSDPGLIRVSVKKAKESRFGISANAGVTVELSNPGALTAPLENLLEAVVGTPLAEFQKQLNDFLNGILTPTGKKLLEDVAKRFGVELPNLPEKWAEIQEKTLGVVKAALASKIQLAFTFEYLRVHADDSVFVADFQPDVLRGIHGDLLLLKLETALDLVRNGQAKLVKYLRQESLERSATWGITLGLGNWKAGGKDKRSLRVITQTNIDKKQRMAYLGVRDYTWQFGKDAGEWKANFSAQMKEFSSSPAPLAREFDFGLSFLVTNTERKLSEDELRSYLDTAVIWRILNYSKINEIVQEVKPFFQGNRAKVEVGFTINNEILRPLVRRAAVNAGIERFGLALGAAMSFSGDYESLRNPQVRQQVYAGLWKFYFENSYLDISSFQDTAFETIRRMTWLPDENALAQLESKSMSTQPTDRPLSFTRQIYKNGSVGSKYSGIADNWKRFADGLKLLVSVADHNSPASHKEIEHVFGLLQSFWDQHFFLRAVGVFLTDLARKEDYHNLFLPIERVCKITFTDSANKTVFSKAYSCAGL